MKFELAFIVPVTAGNDQIRKLVFESPDGQRASVLAGPWSKRTVINKGTIDGAEIKAPYALTVLLKQTAHGPVLRTNGVKLIAEGEAVPATKDGKTVMGADGKTVMNLVVTAFEVTTYVLSAGDDEPALSTGFVDPFDGEVIS